MQIFFSEVVVGQLFFDRYSGEQFRKVSDSEAEHFLTDEKDTFDADEIVEL